MKKKTQVLVLALSALTIISFSYVWGYAKGSGSAPVPAPAPIDLSTAQSLFQSYYVDAEIPTEKLKAFTVSMDQYDAMTDLKSSGASFFRVYFGKTAEGQATSIIVGVSGDNRDKTDRIMQASGAANNAGLCPVFCDEPSPITNQ